MDSEDKVLTGTPEADTLIGGAGADSISGGGDDDILRGGPGNDSLAGGTGSDLLDGGAGDDILNGGPGADTASFDDAQGAVTANLRQGTATGDGLDILNGIENLTGTPFADSLTGNTGDNRLIGGAGADTMVGGGGNDTLIGGTGADMFDLTALDGEATVIDPTRADSLRISDDSLDETAVRAETISRDGEPRAVLRIDRNGDGVTDASLVLSRLARASIDVSPAEDGGTVVTLNLLDLPLTYLSVQDQLSSLYVGLLDRAPDAAGLAYWTGEYMEALERGQDARAILDRIADSFLNSAEAQDLPITETLRTGAADPEALSDAIDVLYDRFFGRQPGDGGTSFWTGSAMDRIEAGRSLGGLVVDIANGAQDRPIDNAGTSEPTLDATVLRNRIELAQQFSDALSEQGVDLGNGVTHDDLRAPLDGATASFTDFQERIDEIQSLVAQSGPGDIDGI